MSELLILGAGGHGKVVADIASMMGKWDKIFFLDDRDDIKEIMGFPVIGKCADYECYKDKFQYGFVAIGNNAVRLEWLHRLLKAGYTVPRIIHPRSSVSRFSSIGIGTVIMAGAVVNASVTIGRGCIVNTSSSIDHDCVIHDGVHISPGAHIGGTVTIGECSWVCIGSSISNNIEIGKHVIVASGAAVVRNVPDHVMVAGVPAITKKQYGDE